MSREVEAVYTEIGKLIRDARITKQLSQAELGSLLKPPKTGASIGMMERGEQRLLPHILIGIAEVLGVSSTDLLPNKGLPRVRKAPSMLWSGGEGDQQQMVLLLSKDIKASRARRV